MSRVQELQIELLRLSSFNALDGDAVADSLLQNQTLWSAVIIDKLASLIKLRDMSDNIYNLDTLYVLASGVDDAKLFKLAQQWKADDIGWIEGKEANTLLGSYGKERIRILQVWWD